MSKKNEKEKEEEKNLEEDADEGDEEEDADEGDEEDEEDEEGEEEEDERPAASARGAEDRRARAHARRAAHGGHDDHDHDDADEEDAAVDEDDPYWWTPHAVMSALVLIGVLGFFGVFNKALGGLAAHPVAHAADEKTATADTTARPTSTGAPAVPEDVKAAPASAQKTASGLAYRLLKKGTGAQQPKASDTVTVNYSGWTTDGKMFDSSITRGQPATFKLTQVIPGWTEGVQLMKVGETMRFWIPAALAYGAKPRPGAPAGDLVFDVELISIH
jgi:FKBP-type peptidyl-prolyl cis-trans isomerase